MGIVDQEIAKFELDDGSHCRVERNVDGRIDVHVGRTQLTFKKSEFEQFSNIIQAAHAELESMKS